MGERKCHFFDPCDDLADCRAQLAEAQKRAEAAEEENKQLRNQSIEIMHDLHAKLDIADGRVKELEGEVERLNADKDELYHAAEADNAAAISKLSRHADLVKAAREFCNEVERDGFHHQLHIVNALAALDKEETK